MRYFPVNLVLIFVLTVVGFWLFSLHAETVAQSVFGRWEKVTVETIRKPVPEWEYTRTALGSVTNYYKRHLVVLEDRPAEPGGPNSSPVSPRSSAPQQVGEHQTNLPERR